MDRSDMAAAAFSRRDVSGSGRGGWSPGWLAARPEGFSRESRSATGSIDATPEGGSQAGGCEKKNTRLPGGPGSLSQSPSERTSPRRQG